VAAYKLCGEDLVWLIGVVVCLLLNLLVGAGCRIDGPMVHCSVIGQSSGMCEIAQCLWLKSAVL